MDFYVDLAVAVLLRLVKDRRGLSKYYRAVAKVQFTLVHLYMTDAQYKAVYDDYLMEQH